MNKIVLIGDIVASRKISHRNQFQEKLIDALEDLNKDNPNLASLYTLTLGDEFQAVFNNANSIFYETIELLRVVYPEKIKFSFGIGDIPTKINYEQALGMDGPAFHNARTGIEELKDSSCLYNIEGLKYKHSNLLNMSLCLFSHSCRNWNQNRFQTLSLMKQGFSAKEIASKLQVSETAVYKNISDGSLETILKMLDEISAIINENLV